MTSAKTLARTFALLFITVLVLGVVAQGVITNRLITFKDPAATASNILANESLYRTGFTLFMLEMTAQMISTITLYHLLKPVSRRVATYALVFGLVGSTIKTMARVLYLMPLFLLKQDHLGAMGTDQLQVMSLVLLRVMDRGAGVALGFFGLETLTEGWLIYRSTFLPRWVGVIWGITGLGWLTFMTPSLGYSLFDIFAVIALLGAIPTVGWLLVKGVGEDRWRAVASE